MRVICCSPVLTAVTVPPRCSLGSASTKMAFGYPYRCGQEASTPRAGPLISPLTQACTGTRSTSRMPMTARVAGSSARRFCNSSLIGSSCSASSVRSWAESLEAASSSRTPEAITIRLASSRSYSLLVHSACGSSHTRVGGTGPGADGGADGKSGAPGVSGVPGIDGTDGLDGQPGSPGRGTSGMCARAIGWLVGVYRAVLCGAFRDVTSWLLPRVRLDG